MSAFDRPTVRRSFACLGLAAVFALSAVSVAAARQTAAPTNTNIPTVSGTARVGEQLTASTGTWTNDPTGYAYQWQQCDASGSACGPIQDATARVFGVRTTDVGHTLRVMVTATNSSGSASSTSVPTAVVTADTTTTTTTGTTTTTTTTPTTTTMPVTTVARNHAPTISFVSFKRVDIRVYVRFRLCDDSAKKVTVIARDVHPGKATYTRRFPIAGLPCRTIARDWVLAPRFRHGKYTVTLRAVDSLGASSRTISRTRTYR